MTALGVKRRGCSVGPEPLVKVEGLTIDFWSNDRWNNVVNNTSFELARGEALGLVGESGCGKTTTALSLLGFQRPGSRIRSGAIQFAGRDLAHLSRRGLQQVRGRRVSLVPQNPTTALSPGLRIGAQLTEAMSVHGVGGSHAERERRVQELIARVRLPDPQRTAGKYPHQLSGGQQQRVVIAMALACDPELIVLDEPTTGLDVTTQAQILDLLRRLRAELGMAMVYVTHNLGVVAAVCDRVGVMYAGELVEDAHVRELFSHPRHPYTRGLISAVPSIAQPHRSRDVILRGLLKRSELPAGCRFAPRCDFAETACFEERQVLLPVGEGHGVACRRVEEVERLSAGSGSVASYVPLVAAADESLLEVADLSITYDRRHRLSLVSREPLVIVRAVTFDLRARETFSLVGESGSGKTTIARTVGGLLGPLAGQITFEGRGLAGTVESRSKDVRREIQLVLQNPDASLNPRQRVHQIIGRPLELYFGLHGKARRTGVEQALEDVRLDTAFASRYPDELSGGERQRIAIARALAAKPRLMLCDEILSALDVSVQTSIVELLRELQAAQGIAYLFISHDLAVVRSLSHRVGVLYLGELCEVGTAEEVYVPPYHPYTHMLLSAVPEIEGENEVSPAARSDPGPSSSRPASACPFAERCPWKVGPVCDEVDPPWQATSDTHMLRCHIPLDELFARAAASRVRVGTLSGGDGPAA
ncbi:MAG: dipeptide ABC transporter ATP-binding protein [Gaiellaceae bacterium]